MNHRNHPTTPPLVSLAASVLAALASTATLAMLALPAPVRAETITCTNITSLPAVITSQGVYCLKQDLATAMTFGKAIDVQTNNVTIDCNGHKLGGLAGGPDTAAKGIAAANRLNLTIRNCNIRGFQTGIDISGGASLVEDNRLDGSTYVGIVANGDGSIVRRNIVSDSGSQNGYGYGGGVTVLGDAEVVDNNITGVDSDDKVYGLYVAFNLSGTIAGNRIRNLAGGPGSAGLFISYSTRVLVSDNQLVGPDLHTGIYCFSGTGHLRDNTVLGFATNINGCADAGGNYSD